MENGANLATRPYRRISYNEKPYAVRVQKTPGTPQAKIAKMQLSRLLVGGECIIFDGIHHTVTIAGTEFDVWDWLELRHRIDQVFIRDEQLEKVGPPRDPATVSSSFLSQNWKALSKLDGGKIRRPPKELKERYQAVITKEDWDNDDD